LPAALHLRASITVSNKWQVTKWCRATDRFLVSGNGVMAPNRIANRAGSRKMATEGSDRLSTQAD